MGQRNLIPFPGPCQLTPPVLLPAGPCLCVQAGRHLAQQMYPATTVQMSPGISMYEQPLPLLGEAFQTQIPPCQSPTQDPSVASVEDKVQPLWHDLKTLPQIHPQPNFPGSHTHLLLLSHIGCLPLSKHIRLFSCLWVLFLARCPLPTLLV